MASSQHTTPSTRLFFDVLTEKFNIQVDNDTVTQLALLHSDIPGYDLPAIEFVSPQEETRKPHTQRRSLYDIYTLRKGACTHD